MDSAQKNVVVKRLSLQTLKPHYTLYKVLLKVKKYHRDCFVVGRISMQLSFILVILTNSVLL